MRIYTQQRAGGAGATYCCGDDSYAGPGGGGNGNSKK